MMLTSSSIPVDVWYLVRRFGVATGWVSVTVMALPSLPQCVGK